MGVPNLTPTISPCLSLASPQVRDARDKATELAARFVSRAASHLASLINQAVEEHASEVTAAAKNSELRQH